jgi:hypothetical protein
MVLKLGHLEKHIINTWKVLKCGGGEGWRRSVGPIVGEIQYCHGREKYPTHYNKKEV